MRGRLSGWPSRGVDSWFRREGSWLRNSQYITIHQLKHHQTIGEGEIEAFKIEPSKHGDKNSETEKQEQPSWEM